MTFPSQQAILFPEKQDAQNTPQRVLFVAEQLVTGTATEGDLTKNLTSESQVNGLYGKRSMMAEMYRKFREINAFTRIDAIGVNEATGNIPTFRVDFDFVGPLAQDTKFTITFGSEKHKFVHQALSGDTGVDIVTALVTGGSFLAQLRDDAPIDPSTVVIVPTTILQWLYVSRGLDGSDLSLRVETDVPGISVTASLFSPGTSIPNLTGILDAVENERYQTIVSPSEYGESFLTDFLDPKFNPATGIQDGMGIMTFTDTLSNILTKNASNSASLALVPNRSICPIDSILPNIGGSILNESWAISAVVAGARALRLTDGASLSGIVNAVGPDLTGGRRIASLPYANTILDALSTIPPQCKFSQAELKQINDAGICTLVNNKNDSSLVMGEFVTTRLTDDLGDPEATFHFLNAVDTGSAIREDIINNFDVQFKQHRVTPGDLIGGGNVTNEEDLRAFFMGRYRILSEENLTVAGTAAELFVDTNLKVEIDFETGAVTFTASVPIVTQLREAIYNLRITVNV